MWVVMYMMKVNITVFDLTSPAVTQKRVGAAARKTLAHPPDFTLGAE